MKNFAIVFLSFVFCFFLTHEASANQRNRNQNARIREGVKSGELTKDETKKLRKEERRTRRMERRMRSDGIITPREGRRLKRAQDKVSKDIYKEKHDGETAPKAQGSELPAPQVETN